MSLFRSTKPVTPPDLVDDNRSRSESPACATAGRSTSGLAICSGDRNDKNPTEPKHLHLPKAAKASFELAQRLQFEEDVKSGSDFATRYLIDQLMKETAFAEVPGGDAAGSLHLAERMGVHDEDDDIKSGKDIATQDLLLRLMKEERGEIVSAKAWSPASVQTLDVTVDSLKLARRLQWEEDARSRGKDFDTPSRLLGHRQLQNDEPIAADHASIDLIRKLMDEDADSLLAQHLEFEEEAATYSFVSTNVLTKSETIESLKRCQRKAIQFVQDKAMKLHAQAMEPLRERIQTRLGRRPEDLEHCLEYIRDDAPIVIHLTESTLAKLSKDTHFRSLFETGTSGGTKDTAQRSKWEDRMFGSAYKGCHPQDRCKYGCLNITGDIRGVLAAHHYGKCFLILKSHLRYRTTFFGRDSGQCFARKGTKETLATHEFYAHVLQSYTDPELSAVLNLSRLQGASSTGITVYKEVQIHGDICLSTDIQALSVPGKRKHASRDFKQLVDDFQSMSGCNVLWQNDLLWSA